MFSNANSNLKDEQYGGEKTLYVSSIWPHTHTHKDTHARTQQQSNKYSASIFPNHACMTWIQKYSFEIAEKTKYSGTKGVKCKPCMVLNWIFKMHSKLKYEY